MNKRSLVIRIFAILFCSLLVFSISHWGMSASIVYAGGGDDGNTPGPPPPIPPTPPTPSNIFQPVPIPAPGLNPYNPINYHEPPFAGEVPLPVFPKAPEVCIPYNQYEQALKDYNKALQERESKQQKIDEALHKYLAGLNQYWKAPAFLPTPTILPKTSSEATKPLPPYTVVNHLFSAEGSYAGGYGSAATINEPISFPETEYTEPPASESKFREDTEFEDTQVNNGYSPVLARVFTNAPKTNPADATNSSYYFYTQRDFGPTSVLNLNTYTNYYGLSAPLSEKQYTDILTNQFRQFNPVPGGDMSDAVNPTTLVSNSWYVDNTSEPLDDTEPDPYSSPFMTYIGNALQTAEGKFVDMGLIAWTPHLGHQLINKYNFPGDSRAIMVYNPLMPLDGHLKVELVLNPHDLKDSVISIPFYGLREGDKLTVRFNHRKDLTGPIPENQKNGLISAYEPNDNITWDHKTSTFIGSKEAGYDSIFYRPNESMAIATGYGNSISIDYEPNLKGVFGADPDVVDQEGSKKSLFGFFIGSAAKSTIRAITPKDVGAPAWGDDQFNKPFKPVECMEVTVDGNVETYVTEYPKTDEYLKHIKLNGKPLPPNTEVSIVEKPDVSKPGNSSAKVKITIPKTSDNPPISGEYKIPVLVKPRPVAPVEPMTNVKMPNSFMWFIVPIVSGGLLLVLNGLKRYM